MPDRTASFRGATIGITSTRLIKLPIASHQYDILFA
jgi:hypothetical protein